MTKEKITVGYRLLNFESQVEVVFLPLKITIKRVTMHDELHEVGGLEISLAEWTEWHVRISGYSLEDVERKGIALIYGLRLFKTGPVGIGEGIISSELSPSNLSEEKIPRLWSYLQPDPEVSGTYILLEEEVEHLQRFFEKFFRIGTMGDSVKRAFQKFSQAIQNGSLKEKVINFLSSLEILFLAGESGEITYKLANRVASFIGKEEDSYQVFTDVKEFYNLRSAAVHGRSVDYENLFQSLPRLESITRKSILGALALKDTFAKRRFTSKLDECLHNQSTKKMLHHEIQKFWEDIIFPS